MRLRRRKRDAIEAVLLRGFVDQPLDHIDHFRPAGAAVGRGRHGGREHGARADMRHRNAVAGGHQSDAFDQRHVGAAMGADIAEIRGAQRQETAVGVERELGGYREIAAHIVADEGFLAFRGPFHRPPDAPRAPGDHREFGKEAVAGAEIAADLAGDDAHRLRTARRGSPKAPFSGARCRRSRHRACSVRSPAS